jgi:hypothetical protein
LIRLDSSVSFPLPTGHESVEEEQGISRRNPEFALLGVDDEGFGCEKDRSFFFKCG